MTRTYGTTYFKAFSRSLRNNMTKAEVLLWIQLRKKQILGQRVLRQYGIGRYIVDFYIPKIKLAIEVDGATHETEEERRRDAKRQSELESLGVTVVRFTNMEIYSTMGDVLNDIRSKVRELTHTS